MIVTKNFTCKSPFQQFQDCLPHCYDMHNISYNEEILNERSKTLWREYSEDILAWLDGEIMDSDLNWNSEIEICKALLGRYVEDIMAYSETNKNLTFESWWKELMMLAMEDNAQTLFNAEGPCDIYGELK